MKITFICDKECIGDIFSLARSMRAKDTEADIILPIDKYDKSYKLESLGSFSMHLPFGNIKVDAFSAIVDSVPCFYLAWNCFGRNHDFYYEDAESISVFCHAALELLRYLERYPEHIFTDSFRTALIPLLLKIKYRYHPELSSVRTMHYINNNRFGRYNRAFAEAVFGIDKESKHILLSSNEVNITKGAILCASRIYVGEGGTSILYDRNSSVHHAAVQFGFKIRKLNMGIDYSLFMPPAVLTERKHNKLIIQRHFRFRQDDAIPLIAICPAGSKETVSQIVKNLSKYDIQLLLLCSRNESYRSFIPPVYTENIREICYDRDKLIRVFSGCDLSVFKEISSDFGNLAYISSALGCVPIIPSHKYFDTGITYFNKITHEGNGFTYDSNIREDMIYTLWDAINLYRNEPKTFSLLITNTMKKDFSIDIAAELIPNETEKSPYFKY